jgi:hypothetical protein
MKHVSRMVVVLAMVLLAGAAQAQEINWKFVQGGWSNIDPDRGSSENGWFVGGSADLGKVPVHLFADFASYDNIDVWAIGGGWHGLLGKRADLFADAALYDADYDDGYRLRFGVRWMVLKRLEVNGNIFWTNLDLTDNEGAGVNAIFDFTKRFGVGGGFEWGDEFGFARAFVRFNFGPRG